MTLVDDDDGNDNDAENDDDDVLKKLFSDGETRKLTNFPWRP